MGAESKPIVFLLGPSGSGKTKLAEWVAEDLGFLHIEIDRWPEGDGIDLAGLRTEWDAYWESGEAVGLTVAIRKRVENDRKYGAIGSFPSNLVLPTPRMNVAEEQGVRPIVLYGTGADCLSAFLRREARLGRGLDANHWVLNNAHAYANFSRPEYSKYRLTVFDPSGHRSRAELVAEVKRRAAG